MSTPGEKEWRTQRRLVELFRDQLGYSYLGDWRDRLENSNIEEDLLRAFLVGVQAYGSNVAERAIGRLKRAAGASNQRLYDRNREVYGLLRFGLKIQTEVGGQHETIHFIDWDRPERNRFAVAEEVALAGGVLGGKRPDLVLYVNGIALGVIELKRSIVDVAEGIRQNIESQKPGFIESFFSTVQLLVAGNDTQGLRYGVIETPERYWLSWKEKGEIENRLDRALSQMFGKDRFLELVHDFLAFDVGTKKICRPHQYLGLKLAQERVARREGGIIWHAQGSGKSLVMYWLARWIYEHVKDPRVLIVTDRIELDGQIEAVMKGLGETRLHRTTSGTNLIASLDSTTPWLLCSLIHKFGGPDDDPDIPGYIAELKKAASANFAPKGNLIVFVDECHRTQSGVLHDAMAELLPDATFIGFTGTPILRKDRPSVSIFGGYIHVYPFDEAVEDGVILDLRYEARDIDQRLTSPEKVDQWFDAKTRGLTKLAKAQIKRRWGTLQEVFSSSSRLDQIVADVLMDMETRDRLMSNMGNALLVSDSIYNACKLYERFSKRGLARRCAIVTSYRPTPAALKGEDSGEGDTERIEQYDIYTEMLADWFHQPAEQAVTRTDEFEHDVVEKFLHEPGQMKLLIVVDKLLTGFDAPPATYLYIDKPMRDHGLFQAICRVNRLDTPDKEYGYIVDYRDLFKSLESAVLDYTSGAFSDFEPGDLTGILRDRLTAGRERLEMYREAVKAHCEPVSVPRDSAAFIRYFCAEDSGNEEELTDNERNRVVLYRLVGSLIRAYADIASDLEAAGYTPDEIEAVRREVDLAEKVRAEVRLASGDAVDLKMYEPAMRHLIDSFIAAEPSTKVSSFDNVTLVDLILRKGPDAIDDLPDQMRGDKSAVAEAIENNIRKLLVDRNPINPRYYDRMSELLDEIIAERRRAALSYRAYLEKVTEFVRQIDAGPTATAYPPTVDTPARRALYDNLGCDEATAVAIDKTILSSRQDGWRTDRMKTNRIRNKLCDLLGDDDERIEAIIKLATKQNGY